jgi:hypothetical protein
MPTNIQRLRVAIEEWLVRNGLATDTLFYEMSDWLNRKESYLNDAELVLVFEGTLHTILNFGGDTDEFDDFIDSFGYYYELGESWNMGFYRIPDFDFTPRIGNYSDKLRDPRWRAKSKLVKENAGWKCQDCGSLSGLETHHCYYTTMREQNQPWEYPLSALRCLCRNCHENRAKAENRMRAFLARFTGSQIDELRGNLDSAFYWFTEDKVIELISKLRHDDTAVLDAAAELLRHRNETT